MLKRLCGFFIFLFLIFGSRDILLSAENRSFELEPIVVTGSKRTWLLNPYQLKSKDMEDPVFSSPVEALTFSPLDLQPRSPQGAIQTDFTLRGSNFQQVLISLDGQRINDPQTGHHNGDIPFTAADIERVEIYPGTGSSIFGPDAIGGALNFVLKKPGEKKAILELKGGEHRTHFQLLSLSDKIENLGLRVSVENHRSAGFREDTGFQNFIANLASSLDLPHGELDSTFGYQEKAFGAFDFYTPGSNYLSKEWTKTYLSNTALDLKLNDWGIKPNFLWRRHFDKFMLDKTSLRSRYLNHHETNIYTPGLYLEKKNSFLQRIGGGLEYSMENINSTNLGKHQRSRESVFFDVDHDLSDALSLAASLRWDDFSTFGGYFTGSFNTRYALDAKNEINLGVSRNSRIPSFTELYYSDPTTVGDPNLDAEKAVNYELGYLHKQETAQAGANFFFRQEDDMIDWVKRSSGQVKFQAENISRDQVSGVEGSFELKVNRYIDWQTNYTYTNKHIDGQSYVYKYGSNYTRHLYNNIFSFHLPFGTQTLSLNYKKKPGRASWLLADLGLSCDIAKKSRLFFTVTNILNTKYEEIVGIPQPGRCIEGGVRVEW